MIFIYIGKNHLICKIGRWKTHCIFKFHFESKDYIIVKELMNEFEFVNSNVLMEQDFLKWENARIWPKFNNKTLCKSGP